MGGVHHASAVVFFFFFPKVGPKTFDQDAVNSTGGHFTYQLKASLGGGLIDEQRPQSCVLKMKVV